MHIHYRLKFTDLLMFQMTHLFWMPLAHCLIILGATLQFWMFRNTPTLALMGEAISVYLIMWFAIFLLMTVYLLSRSNRHYLLGQTLELAPEGVCEETPFSKTLFYWRGLVKVVSRPGFLALYTTPDIAIVVPNRVFENRTQRDGFFRYAQEHMAKADQTDTVA